MAQSLFHRGIGYSHKAEKIAFDKEGNVLRAEYVEHYPPDTRVDDILVEEPTPRPSYFRCSH